MSSNVTSATWNTPQVFGSLEMLTSAQYNNLATDVGFLYAKPWYFRYLNAGASLTLTTTGADILLSGNSTAQTSSPTPFPFTYGAGAVTLPTSTAGVYWPGLYRITCQMTIDATGTTGHARVGIIVQTSGGSVAKYDGPWVDQSTTYNSVASFSIVVPLGTGSTSGGYSVYMTGQWAGASVNAVGSTTAPAVTAGGPTSSPPRYNTWMMIEYLGTSLGSF